jgi:hypothetical protein
MHHSTDRKAKHYIFRRGGFIEMRVMFLDESGNHDLNRINPVYPVFALGGVIVDRAHLRNTIEPEMRDFKLRYFGRDDVILHTVEMASGRGTYGFLANPAKRSAFYAEINDLLRQWDYKVVVCVFELNRFVTQYSQPEDPYHYGLEILIERFCKELGSDEDAGIINAECRNPGLDRALLQAWETLRTGGAGTGHAKSEEIHRKIIDFCLKDKKPNLAGMQLADLVVTPPGRHVAGRAPNPNQIQWTVVESKLRRSPSGSYKGYGLIIRP